MIQQQIFRIAKYILLCTKIILVCNNGFVDPIIKTEVSRFTVFPLKTYNSKFAMYLENHGRLGFWRKKLCRAKIRAPSLLAGVHAMSKVAHYDLRYALLSPLFFLMLLLLLCFWQICKCIEMQLDSLSFER